MALTGHLTHENTHRARSFVEHKIAAINSRTMKSKHCKLNIRECDVTARVLCSQTGEEMQMQEPPAACLPKKLDIAYQDLEVAQGAPALIDPASFDSRL